MVRRYMSINLSVKYASSCYMYMKFHLMCCCSYKSIVIIADSSVISWGSHPTYGELVLTFTFCSKKVKLMIFNMSIKPLEYFVKFMCNLEFMRMADSSSLRN